MLLTSLSLWLLMVYNLRVAFLGNPLLQHVTNAPEDLIHEVDRVSARGGDVSPSPEVALFLRGFIRRFCLGLLALVLELSLLVRLFWIGVLPWVSFSLFGKDLVAAAVGALAAHSLSSQSGMFTALRLAPPWMRYLDRASSLVSGLGAFVILIHIART